MLEIGREHVTYSLFKRRARLVLVAVRLCMFRLWNIFQHA